jgi:hypothetical protein
MSELDAERIAKRLGLTDAVICQLRAHGYLQRLAVTAHELDARIYRAHTSPTSRETPNLPALVQGPVTPASYTTSRDLTRSRRSSGSEPAA